MTATEQYWLDSISEILPDNGVELPAETLEAIAIDLAHSAEMEWEATGQEHIPNPLSAQVDRLKRDAETAREDAERRERILCSHIAESAGPRFEAGNVNIDCGRVEITPSMR